MKTVIRSFAGGVVLLALIACGQRPAATPPMELPTLQRQTLTLKTPEGARTLVPSSALIQRGGMPGVFVLRDGRARFRMVKSGKAFTAQTEILSGLRGTETLVLNDLQAVHDGSPIQAN